MSPADIFIRGVAVQQMDNKWRKGKTAFELAGALPLQGSGVLFEEVLLDAEIGPEVVALLADLTPFAYALRRRRPLELRLRSGAVKTGHGVILFLLWYVPPVVNGKPFALYEQLMNPGHPLTLVLLSRLASQTHLHLLLLGPGGHLLGVYEFENTFGFERILAVAERVRRTCPTTDFEAAKVEYGNSYDMMELFAMLEPA